MCQVIFCLLRDSFQGAFSTQWFCVSLNTPEDRRVQKEALFNCTCLLTACSHLALLPAGTDCMCLSRDRVWRTVSLPQHSSLRPANCGALAAPYQGSFSQKWWWNPGHVLQLLKFMGLQGSQAVLPRTAFKVFQISTHTCCWVRPGKDI